MLDKMNVTRRGFMRTTGSLTLSFSLAGRMAGAQQDAGDVAELPGNLNRNDYNRMLGSWIAVHEDGTVTLMIGKVELGQGTVTSAAMVAADELYIDIAKLDVISGDTWLSPDEGTTAGSGSAPGCMPAVQAAAAEVRETHRRTAAPRPWRPRTTDPTTCMAR